MGGRRCQGSATVWAWIISICVHTVLLLCLGLLRLSPNNADLKITATPQATLSQVKKLIDSAPVMSKPKITKSLNCATFQKNPQPLPSIESPRLRDNPPRSEIENSSRNTSANSVKLFPKKYERGEVTFFSSTSNERKVCYVVDCSGSMQGLFGKVREELKRSINNLQADQYFYIIFFGSGNLNEYGNGRLVRATDAAKDKAFDFIDRANPAGATNAADALTKAMRIRDEAANASEVIYFLTDGFELTQKESSQFLRQLSKLKQTCSPKTRINTLGFWANSDDCELLRDIANQSGGRFVLIDRKIQNGVNNE